MILNLEDCKDGWVVDEAHRMLTENRYWDDYKPDVIRPIEAIVYHYTASMDGYRTAKWLCAKQAKASAHFVVDLDGTVWQLAPLTSRTWHAGGRTSKLHGGRNVNGRTIGIEMTNWGKLTRRSRSDPWEPWASTQRHPRTYDGAVMIDPDDVLVGWPLYTDALVGQVKVLTSRLGQLLPHMRHDPQQTLVGHEDVDPRRKLDPGPAFARHWPSVRSAVLL